MAYKKINQLSFEELHIKIKNTDKSFASMIKAIKKSEDMLIKVNNMISVDFENAELIEKLYSIKLNLDKYPKCKICGNKAKFESKKWSDFCDGTCGYVNMWENINDDDLNKRTEKFSNTYNKKTETEKKSIKEKRKQTLNKKYGVDHNFKLESVIEKREETWLEKYGYTNPNKSDIVKSKIEKTNIEKYGFKTPLLNEKINRKAKETLYSNYKVDHNSKSDFIKEKFKNTCIEKYGHPHFMQNAEKYTEITKKTFKWKKIELNGKIHNVQGYEDIAIKYLINQGIPEDAFITTINDISKLIGPIYWIDDNNKKHRYYPDFYITETNTLYEIKSLYTYNVGMSDGSLMKKFNACQANNTNIKILVFDKKENLILEI